MTKKLTPKQMRIEILRLLNKLDESNHEIFKLMYSNKDLDKDISDVVNDMPAANLAWALQQCKNSYYNFFESMKR